ncbi:MAG: DUF3488 and transglutaminase-like domain-containing protein [Candidatus Sumerlaeia bacterium]|nr:DUF3488 and transglutaminase-like domain-containing protein [Candidatus Sumerlaeia bacterium]
MVEAVHRPIPVLRRLDLLIYVLVWLGGLSLLLVPGVSPQMVLVFCLLIAPSLFLGSTQRSAAYRTAWRLITLAFIVLSLAYLYWDRRLLQQTLVVQLCFFQAYKAYNNKNHADYLEMALFALLMVVLGGLFSRSLFFAVLLVPFVVVAIAFFLTLNLSRQYLQRRPAEAKLIRKLETPVSGFQIPPARIALRDLAAPHLVVWIQTAAVFAVGLALFYAMPRDRVLPPSYFSYPPTSAGRDPVLSGLTGGVDLRHLSAIKNDPRPAVKVEFPDGPPPPDQLYLRMASLERITHLEWFTVQRRRRLITPDGSGVFWFQTVAPADLPRLIQHRVEFLNGPSDSLLALPGLVAVDEVESRQREGHIARADRLASLRRYRAFSWGIENLWRSSAGPEDEFARLESVRLPLELANSTLYAKASEIAYGKSDDLARARAIEQYLRSRYSYTLDIERLNGPRDGPSPIERFLFDCPQGNCEVFASAMAILCRNLGIPARLAIGYHGGIRGDSPKEVIFRNQDAHVWVEVWTAQSGWMTFDPTPPPPLEVYSGRFSFKELMEWFNRVSARWDRLVVSYDREDTDSWMSFLWEPVNRWVFQRQSGLIGRLMPRLRENIGRPEMAGLLGWLLAANLLAAFLYVCLRRRWAKRRTTWRTMLRRSDPWHEFYRLAVAALKGRLALRVPHQTPGEFLELLGLRQRIDPAVLRPLLDFYHAGRFGGMAWNVRCARQADALLNQLRQAARFSRRNE